MEHPLIKDAMTKGIESLGKTDKSGEGSQKQSKGDNQSKSKTGSFAPIEEPKGSSSIYSSDTSSPSENEKDKESHVSSHHKLKDPESINYDVNTYTTIFDNIFRRTLDDMTLREKVRKELLVELGKSSAYAYQKLAQLESKATDEFYASKVNERNVGSVVYMENPLASTDVRLMNRELMRGKYAFVFPEKANTLRKKYNRVALEPTAFQLYKRGDYSSKIDVISTDKMRMAQLLYSLVTSAKKDRTLAAEQRALLENDEVMQAAKEAAKSPLLKETERTQTEESHLLAVEAARAESRERSEISWKERMASHPPPVDVDNDEQQAVKLPKVSFLATMNAKRKPLQKREKAQKSKHQARHLSPEFQRILEFGTTPRKEPEPSSPLKKNTQQSPANREAAEAEEAPPDLQITLRKAMKKMLEKSLELTQITSKEAKETKQMNAMKKRYQSHARFEKVVQK